MSEIRVTSIVGENGEDRVGLTTGLTVGPLTGTTGIGATISHHGHAQFAGVCTATSFSGSGANLTGISAGKILQIVQGTTTDAASFSTSNSFVDGGVSATMTPSAASSKILVSYRILLGQSAGNVRSTRLAKSVAGASYSAVTNANVFSYSGNTQTTSQIHPIDLDFLDTPSYSLGQTVAYRVEINSYNTTLYRNRYGAGTNLGAMMSTITLMEVAS